MQKKGDDQGHLLSADLLFVCALLAALEKFLGLGLGELALAALEDFPGLFGDRAGGLERFLCRQRADQLVDQHGECLILTAREHLTLTPT